MMYYFSSSVSGSCKHTQPKQTSKTKFKLFKICMLEVIHHCIAQSVCHHFVGKISSGPIQYDNQCMWSLTFNWRHLCPDTTRRLSVVNVIHCIADIPLQDSLVGQSQASTSQSSIAGGEATSKLVPAMPYNQNS